MTSHHTRQAGVIIMLATLEISSDLHLSRLHWLIKSFVALDDIRLAILAESQEHVCLKLFATGSCHHKYKVHVTNIACDRAES